MKYKLKAAVKETELVNDGVFRFKCAILVNNQDGTKTIKGGKNSPIVSISEDDIIEVTDEFAQKGVESLVGPSFPPGLSHLGTLFETTTEDATVDLDSILLGV